MNVKKLLLIASALLSATAAFAQYESGVISFYQANPDLDHAPYEHRIVNPAYWLVDSGRWNEMDDRLLSSGYVRLGVSCWTGPVGVPDRAAAVSFASSAGADVVIYSVRQDEQKYNYSVHQVGFYARQSVPRAAPATKARPSNAQATAAINRFQDAHSEPHVRGGVSYDAQTDTYNWIGPKTGQAVSKPATWFLDMFGAYLG